MSATAPDLISFIHSTPTPFHLVTEAEGLLTRWWYPGVNTSTIGTSQPLWHLLWGTSISQG